MMRFSADWPTHNKQAEQLVLQLKETGMFVDIPVFITSREQIYYKV